MEVPRPFPIRVPPDAALARAASDIPEPRALPGGCRYEPKWDGFRAFVAVGGRATIWSRQGTDMTGAFPEIADAAAAQLPEGVIVDGEIVAWHDGRLDFDILQSRLASGASRRLVLAQRHPATLVVFDVLANDGQDLRPRRFDERRAVLEALAGAAKPPLSLSPITRDLDTARGWFTDLVAAGVEGLVVKGGGQPYLPGHRDWVKVKHRESVDVVIGAVIGPIRSPRSVVVGFFDQAGVLRISGRSTELHARQSSTLGGLLSPAGPDHPWPEEAPLGRFGSSRERVKLTRVAPIVCEVSADTARTGSSFRHVVRFLRARPDLDPEGVTGLGR